MSVRIASGYEKELTDFLYQHIRLKEYYIAWIPETYKELSSLEKNSFILCLQNDQIVGCMGAYCSHEQRLVRMLGPIIDKEYFDKYIDTLYERFLQSLPENIAELRVAFYQENGLCRHWCEKNGFQLYNAETTMMYNREAIVDPKTDPSVSLEFYESQYKHGLSLVHPTEAFFTLDELIQAISDHHRLLLAIVRNEVAGYVYFEQTEDRSKGEIQLLHVREDKRDLGYGSALLNRAISDLLKNSAEEISINVRVNNPDAHRLYKRAGFTDRETIYAYKKPL